MSAGWEVGDLALCVNTDAIRLDDLGPCFGHGLAFGRVYTVAAVFIDCEDPAQPNCLLLENDDPDGRLATRFRKIKPDAHEDCEAEFVTLLNRIKRPAKQGEPA